MTGAVPYNGNAQSSNASSEGSAESFTQTHLPKNKQVGLYDMIESTAFDRKKQSIDNYNKYRKCKFQYDPGCE
tara:strand:+ start:6750 stop:6968 length:219 start_codon:yes stop_codon:yes gene_type:complete